MTEPLKFFVRCHPKPQQRHRDSKVCGKYDPSASDKTALLIAAQQYAPDVPHSKPVRVDITWHIMRPKNHYRTGRWDKELKPTAPKYCEKYDRDNLDKFVLDALAGVFWDNDKIVCAGYLEKRWCCRYYGTPGVEITIKEL